MTCVIDERATPKPLSNRIKAARLAVGLSQQDLAGRVGVAVASVSRWERGISRPFPRQLAKLAEATEQDLAHFADEDEAARPSHPHVPHLLAECFRAIAEQLEARGVRVAIDPTRATPYTGPDRRGSANAEA